MACKVISPHFLSGVLVCVAALDCSCAETCVQIADSVAGFSDFDENVSRFLDTCMPKYAESD